MGEFIIGFDIGGTNIRGALFEKDSSEIIARKEVLSIKGDKSRFLEQVKRVYDSLKEKADGEVICVSLVVPGPVVDNVLQCAPPLLINNSIDFSFLHENVYVENDMNGAAMAELNFGEGKDVSNFYVLTLSTNIGVGIVLNKKVVGGVAGEFGHNVVERSEKRARQCGCGQKGCWGIMAGGYGVSEYVKNEFVKGMSIEEFFENKSEKAKLIVKQIRDYNAHGIGIMLNVLPSEKIIIMGSLGLKQFENIIPNKDEIGRYWFVGCLCCGCGEVKVQEKEIGLVGLKV